MRVFLTAVRCHGVLRRCVRSLRWVKARFSPAPGQEPTDCHGAIVALPNCVEIGLSFGSTSPHNSVAEALAFASKYTPAARTFRLDAFQFVGTLGGPLVGLERVVLSTIIPRDDALRRVWSPFRGSLKKLGIEAAFLFPTEMASLTDFGDSLTELTLWISEDDDDGNWDPGMRLAKLLPRLEQLSFRPHHQFWLIGDEPFPSLRALQLELKYAREVRRVASHLSGEAFPALHTIGVWFDGGEPSLTESDSEDSGNGSPAKERRARRKRRGEEALAACRAAATRRGIRWSIEKPTFTEWM